MTGECCNACALYDRTSRTCIVDIAILIQCLVSCPRVSAIKKQLYAYRYRRRKWGKHTLAVYGNAR
jgi:hypothetical protein